MGPMAGIGDSLSQFCLAPLFATIGASLAQDGLILGPAIFFLGMNITLLIIKLLMGNWGHKLGASIIEKLSSYMEQISTIAGMIGVTVISGLAVNFVKISTKLQYVAQVSETEEKIISLQEMLDAMPAIEETKFVRHVRFAHPLRILMDGKKQEGAVLFPK